MRNPAEAPWPTHHASCINDTDVELDPFVSDALVEGVLDGGVVAIHKMILHELYCDARLAYTPIVTSHLSINTLTTYPQLGCPSQQSYASEGASAA